MTIETMTRIWTNRRIRFALIAGLCLLLGGVYVSEALLGNAQGDTGAVQASARVDAMRPFAKGEIAAFVVAEEPKPVPDIRFVGRDGRELSLSDWKGKTVLVNLWATWCDPCKREMPALEALQKELGGDSFQVVAINIDRGGPDKGERFYAEKKLQALGFYHDQQAKIFRQVRGFGMPTSFLVDPNGLEIGRLAGPAEWHSKDALDLIKAAIGAGISKG